mmetsp:Transcript_58305/g.164607  ORF Transcript_58305/g.164607 Transcript_58305/m.164607 type:complete len:213 (+) Transcript_58305:415-1053(+)
MPPWSPPPTTSQSEPRSEPAVRAHARIPPSSSTISRACMWPKRRRWRATLSIASSPGPPPPPQMTLVELGSVRRSRKASRRWKGSMSGILLTSSGGMDIADGMCARSNSSVGRTSKTSTLGPQPASMRISRSLADSHSKELPPEAGSSLPSGFASPSLRNRSTHAANSSEPPTKAMGGAWPAMPMGASPPPVHVSLRATQKGRRRVCSGRRP